MLLWNFVGLVTSGNRVNTLYLFTMTPLPGYWDADRDQPRTRYARDSNAQCIDIFINTSPIDKMGFTCAAAGCTSNSRKPLHKYPWMQDVTWVKWPKRVAVSNRRRRRRKKKLYSSMAW